MSKKKKIILIAAIVVVVAVGIVLFTPKPIIEKNVPNANIMNMYMVKEYINDFTPEKITGEKIYLENVDTAKDFAKSIEPVLFEIYGKENIIGQRPYTVMFDEENQVWYLKGSADYLNHWLFKNQIACGGVVYAVASKETGEVLMIIHTE